MKKTLLAVAALAVALVGTAAGADSGGPYSRVAMRSDGTEGNNASAASSMSSDGRYVAFFSLASNLVPGDTNGVSDIFVKDRQTGELERVSVASDGTQANGDTRLAEISGDGRWVIFTSAASNLVAGDANESADAFLHDRWTRETTRISGGTIGPTGGGGAGGVSISEDGSVVAFDSTAADLVPGDTNGVFDAFVLDRDGGTLRRVSLHADGTQSTRIGGGATLSADGRVVAIETPEALVPTDQNENWDVYAVDLRGGTVTQVSVDSSGAGAPGYSEAPSLSADGRFVAFSGTSALSSADRNVCDSGIGYTACRDIFVRDRISGVTTLEDVNSSGVQADSDSTSPSISADGRYITFDSLASNLGAGRSMAWDIFVRDRVSGATIGISDGDEVNFPGPTSEYPAIAGDGSAVAFSSDASDFVPGDTNGTTDAIVWSPCPLGSRMAGIISRPIREEVEPRSGAHSFTVRDLNCNVIEAAGL